MQPCAVCGGVTINATGHCVRCGTFRGNPPQDAPGGYAAAPYQPPPSGYGSPAAPGFGQPTSGGGGYPVSAQPGAYSGGGVPAHPQPASGGSGYPASYPPPGPGDGNRAKPFVVPLVALSITLIVLVVAIVIVVLVRRDQPVSPIGGPTSPAVDAAVDPCVVGRWRVASHREDVPMANVGNVRFTGGQGATVELAAGGTGRTTYDGTRFAGTARGQKITLEFNGGLEFEFTARDGTLSFKNMRGTGTAEALLDGEQILSEPISGSDDPAKYTCSGDTMTQTTGAYHTRFTRLD